jgi:nucleoporin NDC1
VLSRLVCASLTEDRYGVVQRDIPRILESLLAFLTALEDAQKEIQASDDAEETARANDVYTRPVGGTLAPSSRKLCQLTWLSAMKEAVVRIVQTFGPRLTAFRFPYRIAQKLQGFADYY